MGLVSIGGGHFLEARAAEQYFVMIKAGCPVGGIKSSTRAYELQMSYYINQGRPGWPALADHPNLSKHVYRPTDSKDIGARALDFFGDAKIWVREHGHDYGFMKDRVRGEDWHIEFEYWNVQITEEDMGLTYQETMNAIAETAAKSVQFQDAIRKAVWTQAVSREGQLIPIIQEIADTKTEVIAAKARELGQQAAIDNMKIAIERLSSGEDFDEAKLAQGVLDTFKAYLADELNLEVSFAPKPVVE